MPLVVTRERKGNVRENKFKEEHKRIMKEVEQNGSQRRRKWEGKTKQLGQEGKKEVKIRIKTEKKYVTVVTY